MQPGIRLGSFRDWAAMARLPNIPTVWSNVFTAWVVGGAPIDGASVRWVLGCLLAGTLLYAGGAILGDVADTKHDAQARPERALPSGRVAWAVALIASLGLLLGGTLVLSTGVNPFLPWLLCVIIVLYAILHKRLPAIGVLLMGLCRAGLAGNVFFTVWAHYDPGSGLSSGSQVDYAFALWAYVSVISFLALAEADFRVRKIIGWMLAALPLLDAVFLLAAGEAVALLVPAGCLALALAWRRLASPT